MKHVLVVDDEESVGIFLAIALAEAGFTVATANDDQSALTSFRAKPADVLMIDLQMPGMDGPATLQKLRTIDARVPCCFMSGDTGSYSPRQLIDGRVVFLLKPFEARQVVQKLLDLLTTCSQKVG